MNKAIVILQFGQRGGGHWTVPYDSTQNTGAGFGIFVAAVFLFLIIGTVKAFNDDKKWNGRVMNRPQKKKKDQKGSGY
jgi:hypothetical protein